MNSKELGIYTALTHKTAREDYRITDNGTKIYAIVDGGLVYFEGEALDRMSHANLYQFTKQKIRELRESRYFA